MRPYKGILATYQTDNITVGELKKVLSAVPDDYELIWSNQFEGVNEGIGTVAVDGLSKRLYFASEGACQDEKSQLDELWKSIVLKEWQFLSRHPQDNEQKAKVEKALEGLG